MITNRKTRALLDYKANESITTLVFFIKYLFTPVWYFSVMHRYAALRLLFWTTLSPESLSLLIHCPYIQEHELSIQAARRRDHYIYRDEPTGR